MPECKEDGEQDLNGGICENSGVQNSASSHLQQLSSHLASAQSLVEQLGSDSDLTTVVPHTSGPSEVTARYREAERRANEAEVALSKLHREIDHIKAKAQASVREVQRLAFQDPLTNLANTNLLVQHLESLPERFGQETVCLLLDVDRFCVVNQSLGHEAGDALLIQVGQRLHQLVNENLAVGRIGEDEFAVILSGVPSKEVETRSSELVKTVKQALSEAYFVGGEKLELTFSMGASFTPGRAANARELLRQADLALAHIKRHGRAHFALFDETLHRELQRDTVLEFQLRHGLDNNEFFLEYLPLVWLEEKGSQSWQARIVGVEALVRWRHRIEGVLGPDQFLPMAEKTGLIVPLGEWVIRQSIRQLKAWADQGVGLFININLYARQLIHPGFIDTVKSAVETFDVRPASVSFELTDNVANFDNSTVDETLKQLESQGFSLAIDNFGEGHFSLPRMAKARFLKLSRAVVGGEIELCRKAVNVALGMGLIPVGIGVENIKQARFLAQHGCLMLQGYYFSSPKEARDITELVRTEPAWEL